MAETLKPNRAAFVTFYRLRLFAIGLLITLLGVPVGLIFGGGVGIAIIVVLLIVGLVLIALRSIRYRKESYIIDASRLVRTSGSLLSDARTELNVANITHVRLILPWIEHKLFKTGHIKVQSAGSQAVEVDIISVDDPEVLFKRIEQLMHESGFSLARQKRLAEERPSPFGAMMEVAGLLLGVVLFLFFFAAQAGVALVAEAFDLISGAWALVILLVVLLILAGIAAFATIRHLDLTRRRYRVYDDTVTYEEGYLTKEYAFIPMENLADSSTNQNLLEMLFGIYDVKLSCQGSGQEINFRNMRHGKRLEQVLDATIEAFRKRAPKARAKQKGMGAHDRLSSSYAEAAPKAAKRAPTRRIAELKGGPLQLRMDPSRALIPALLWFLPIITIPVALGLLITKAIAYAATTYEVRRSGVFSRFAFLSTKTAEFSYEKITGVIERVGVLDRFFNTRSITFWSIGSGSDITFSHIKQDQPVLDDVLGVLNIAPPDDAQRLPSQFSINAFVRSSLISWLLGLILLCASATLGLIHPLLFAIPLLLLAAITFGIAYHAAVMRRTCVLLHGEGVTFETGLLTNKRIFTDWDDIKDLVSRRYVGSSVGDLTINIAGEHVVQTQKGQSMTVSNAFTVPYVADVERIHRVFDEVLRTGRPPHEIASANPARPVPLRTSRPALANAIVPASLVAFILVLIIAGPVWVMLASLGCDELGPICALVRSAGVGILALIVAALALALFLVALGVRRRRYSLEHDCVRARWGILYRRMKTVLHAKIDHISMGQGALNKLFANGTVTINTVGSGQVELAIANIRDYRDFHAELERYYR